MTGVLTEPQLMAAAATDVGEIHSAIGAANAAAAGPTTGLAAAASDEVSAAAAKLFSTYAAEYQAVVRQASAFHAKFAAALAAAGTAYAEAEAANATAVSGLLGKIAAPVESLLGIAPTTTPVSPPVTPVTPVTPVATIGQQIALIMGGSGLPIPTSNPTFVPNIFKNYLSPAFANFTPQELFTPEGLYPFTGTKSLTLNDSVAQGVTILNNVLFGTADGQNGLLINSAGTTDNHVVVFGLSQSADIASLEMNNLAAMGNPLTDQLSFVLTGNQMTPNGGLLSRFPGFPQGTPLQLPSLGITFYGATPDATPYHTTNYTLMYDGYADFPRYPINIISDLNAFIGIETVHGTYPTIDINSLTPQQLILLPGSVDNPAPGGIHAVNTDYYMINTGSGLPLANVIRAIPLVGNPIADLVEPDLTTIVNLGYGNPAYGYSTAPANLQTTFGLWPHEVSNAVIAQDLITGAQQGANAFIHDITGQASSFSLSSLSHSLTSMAGTGEAAAHSLLATLATGNPIDNIIQSLQTAVTNSSNTIANVGAGITSLVGPTVDIGNALVTVMPAYDVNLFLNGIGQAFSGDVITGLVNAIGLPLAADAALITLATGFQLVVILNGVESIVAAV